MSAERIVIDASVALKWRLRGEEADAEAEALLDDFLGGRIRLIAPTLKTIRRMESSSTTFTIFSLRLFNLPANTNVRFTMPPT